jgi:hypothetical protein
MQTEYLHDGSKAATPDLYLGTLSEVLRLCVTWQGEVRKKLVQCAAQLYRLLESHARSSTSQEHLISANGEFLSKSLIVENTPWPPRNPAAVFMPLAVPEVSLGAGRMSGHW